MNKLVVVISPLIALMQDQVLSLQNKGIKACYFGSQQKDKTLQMADHNVIYITPEFYKRGRGKEYLDEVRHKVILFAVDEAHILEQWGNDFRQDYKVLKKFRDYYPNIPIIALTATAPKHLENIIISSLKLRNYHYTKTALDRPNLQFIIRHKTNSYISQVLPLLLEVDTGSAIVYCLSRIETEEMSKAFNRFGIKTRPYNAGLPRDFRQSVVNDFRNNKLRFVICTIAFGMGIDKPDVRLLVHYGVPKSLEAYYQEVGRAGRDGKPSKCVLFHCDEDFMTVSNFIEDKKPGVTEESREQQRNLLRRVAQFLESTQCRRIEILNYLGTTQDELAKLTIREDCCDNCKQDWFHKIPPHLKYEGLNSDGTCDLTYEARTLFNAVNGKLSLPEVIKVLLGKLPTRETFKWFNLSLFGKGAKWPHDFWFSLVYLFTRKKFIRSDGNALFLKKKVRKFLSSNKKMLLYPTLDMLEFMKDDKVEFFWDNNEIKCRPKGSGLQVFSQDDDDHKYDAALLEVTNLIEEMDRLNRFNAIEQENKLNPGKPPAKLSDTNRTDNRYYLDNDDFELMEGHNSNKRNNTDAQGNQAAKRFKIVPKKLKVPEL